MNNCSFLSCYLSHQSLVQELDYWSPVVSLIQSNQIPQTSFIVTLSNNNFRNITCNVLFNTGLRLNFTIFNNLFEDLGTDLLYFFKIEGVLDTLYFGFSDYYADFSNATIIMATFVGSLIHYSNLNLKFNYLNSEHLFIQLVQSAIYEILDYFSLEIVQGEYISIFSANYEDNQNVTLKISDCVFKGSEGINANERHIISRFYYPLVLFKNVTFDFKLGCQIRGKFYNYFGFYLNSLVNAFLNLTNVNFHGIGMNIFFIPMFISIIVRSVLFQ